MIKLIGPSQSNHASGKLADALIYSNSKKRAYAKTHAKPKNPKTKLQTSTRAMMKFLSQEWKQLTTAEKATWTNLAKVTEITPYHAYVAYNSLRWYHFAAPSKQNPATEASPPPPSNALTGTPGIKMITIQLLYRTHQADWGCLLYRDVGSFFVPSKKYLVAAFPMNPSGNTIYVDTPLESGNYYYFTQGFNQDGKLGSQRPRGPIVVS